MKAASRGDICCYELVLYFNYINMINPKRVEDENLQEEIMCLAEDIIDLNEKSEELDNHILTMLKLLNETTVVLHDTIEIVKDHEDSIRKLDEVDSNLASHIIWVYVLSILTFIISLITAYNVFL